MSTTSSPILLGALQPFKSRSTSILVKALKALSLIRKSLSGNNSHHTSSTSLFPLLTQRVLGTSGARSILWSIMISNRWLKLRSRKQSTALETHLSTSSHLGRATLRLQPRPWTTADYLPDSSVKISRSRLKWGPLSNLRTSSYWLLSKNRGKWLRN